VASATMLSAGGSSSMASAPQPPPFLHTTRDSPVIGVSTFSCDTDTWLSFVASNFSVGCTDDAWPVAVALDFSVGCTDDAWLVAMASGSGFRGSLESTGGEWCTGMVYTRTGLLGTLSSISPCLMMTDMLSDMASDASMIELV